jgi:hypothetical protein
LTASFLTGIENNPAVPASVTSQATTKLAGGAPFVSDKDLNVALEKAGVPADQAKAITDENAKARLEGLRSSLSVLALIALIAVLFTFRIPTRQPGTEPEAAT